MYVCKDDRKTFSRPLLIVEMPVQIPTTNWQSPLKMQFTLVSQDA